MVDDKLQSLLGSVSKYLQKAVEAREMFYRGQDDAALKATTAGGNPRDAKYSFTKSVLGGQLIADNKWHMAQSRTFALAASARGAYLLVAQQQRTNALLEENNKLLKEVRDALRNGRDPGQRRG